MCRKRGISDATFYKWRSKFGGKDVSDARKLKSLDDFTRECLTLVVDNSLFGIRVARELDRIAEFQGHPCMIGSELQFTSQATIQIGIDSVFCALTRAGPLSFQSTPQNKRPGTETGPFILKS